MAVAQSSTDHLAALRRDAQAVLEEVEQLVAGVDASRLRERPAPDRWSVADCLTHLAVTGDAYHPRIRAALAAWRADRTEGGVPPNGEYRPSLFGRFFIRLTGPRGRNVKTRARGPFAPPPAGDDAVQRFRATQAQLLSLIEAAAFADLQRIRIPSPLIRLLALSLGECLEMLVGHERRHLQQMRETLAALEEKAASAGQWV